MNVMLSDDQINFPSFTRLHAKGLRLLWLLVTAWGAPLAAQPPVASSPPNVVVGLLTGEQDIRQLALKTRNGVYLVRRR
jgi:hypothetical protein